jgi:hypothetical protein
MYLMITFQRSEVFSMPGTGIGLVLIDFVFRPFAKIFEKMPFLMLGLLIILYGAIAYVVLKSAFSATDERKPY